MSPRPEPRTASCTPEQARARLRDARAYLDLAEVAASTTDPNSHERAALVGNAVIAGIAAADAICGMALGRYSRGQDHTQAVSLLGQVRGISSQAPARFQRLLQMKGAAHYSSATISAAQADQALRIARELVGEADRMTA